MMKINLLLPAALILALAGGAHAAEVYKTDNASLEILGRVKVQGMNNDADPDHRLKGTARLGVSGRTRVMDNFHVFGYLLYDLAAQDPAPNEDRIKIRYGYAGFDFNYAGKLSFGRFENAYYRVSAVTDLYDDFGNTGVSYWGLTPNDVGGRMDGQAMYDVNLNGWFLSASYQFKDASKHVENGWAGSFGYEFDDVLGSPLGIMAGYSRFKGRRDDNYGYHADGFFYGADKTEWGVSAYYGTFRSPGFYAAALYNHAWLKNTYLGDGTEVALSYTTPGGDFTFLGSYGYMKSQRPNYTRYRTSRLTSGWTFMVSWSPVASMQTYAEFEHKLKAAYQAENENKATLGVIYNF